jgi:hypothetical protein
MIFNNELSTPTTVSCPSETCPIMNGQVGVLIISAIEKMRIYIHLRNLVAIPSYNAYKHIITH